MPVLPRRRDEIGEPVQKLKRREFDDAIGPRPRGLPAAAGPDPVGGFVSGQHVADFGCAAVWAAGHGQSFERERRPGTVSEKMFETAKPVLIVDLDAHCGGGTASLVRDDTAIWQVDVSTSNFDMYGDSDRCEVDIISDAAAYLPKVVERLRRLDATRVDFVLCIYFSGMDPHEGCAFGGRAGSTGKVLEERERVVFGWAASRQLPVAFALGGGYSGAALSRDRLVALHRLTLAVALGHQGGQCDVQSEIRDGSKTAAKSTILP
jgi:hypothetical protein